MTPFEVATAFVVCLQTAYETDDNPPAEICHRPGREAPLNWGTAQDECCTGLAWVRIASIEPQIDPSIADTPDYNPCTSGGTRLVLELGAARCNPAGTQAAGPTCEQWTELAERIDLDAAAMRRAVCCAAQALPTVSNDMVTRTLRGLWEPLDSSGGCAGGTMTVTVWLDCVEC
jgi:hypothetical protein